VRCGRRASEIARSELELLRPESAEAASAALGNGSVALAGGTELVPLLRDGIVRAETLIELRDIVPRGIAGTRIGAGTTLAELEVDPEIPQALREACSLAASPQLRSMGTLGGNLLQATRCWYWRLKFPCYLHGGDTCHAKAGQHREHAIFGNERCASAHPSDPAAALLALGARLRTTARELPLADLYRLPTNDDRDVTALEPGELILELEVPRPEASVYLKAMERRKWSFALVGVAAARFADGIRLALAGVAPIPWALASADALEEATPLPGTAYKVDIARALIRRAVEAVGSAPAGV
jgi:xanthine dehydrogenase YagS FAD-binding subunit